MHLSLAQLQRSLHITETIESLQAELHSIFGTITGAITPKPAKTKGKRKKRRAAEVKGGTDVGNPDVKSIAPKKKGKMSAKGRAAIAAAQKARWAKVKGGSDTGNPEVKKITLAAAPAKAKKKGGMSAAGKARIVAAQKKRWAKVRAAKGTK